jgi:MFS family permease
MTQDEPPVDTVPVAPVRRQAPSWFYAYLPNKIGTGATISLTAIYLTEVLGGTLAQVGVVTSLTSAASVPAAAFWGWLSDRVGTRKLYLILGFLGFGVPTLLMGLSQTVFDFVLLSVLVGALSVAGTPVSSTLIMDTTPKADWDEAFGRFNQVSGWGMVAGRLVGLACIVYGTLAFGNELTQRGIWVLGGLLSMLSVGWAWWKVPALGLPKPRPPRSASAEAARHTGFSMVERVRFLPQSLYYLPRWNPVASVRSVSRLLRRAPHRGWALLHEPLIAYLWASFFQFTMSTMAYTPFAVWQRQDLGNSTGDVFLVGLMNSVAATLSYRTVGVWTRKHGSLRVQMATVGLRVAVFGGFAVMSWGGMQGPLTLVLLMVLQILSGLGWAGIAVAGNSTVAHLAPQGNEGAAMGAYTSISSIGAIVGAFVSGYLVQWLGYGVVFGAGAAGTGLAVLVLWWVRRSVADPAEHHL